MGNPNEPHDQGQHPTENFAHPVDAGNQPPPAAPTHQFAAPGEPEPSTSGRARTWMTGTRRTIVLTGMAGLVVGGVAGGLIGWASTGDSSTTTTTTAQSAPLHGQKHTQAGAAGQRHRAGTIGTITAVNGQSWTVATRGGKSVTVQIGAGTEFGTAKQPQQQSDFAVGDRVVVAGKGDSGTVDATRVVKRATKPGTSTAPSSSVPGATTQPS